MVPSVVRLARLPIEAMWIMAAELVVRASQSGSVK